MKSIGLKYFLLNGYEEYNNSVMKGGATVSDSPLVNKLTKFFQDGKRVDQLPFDLRKIADIRLIKQLKPKATIQELHWANYNKKDILSFGFTVSELTSEGLHELEPSDFREAGYPASELKTANNITWKAKDLFDGGYSLEKLREAGYDENDLEDIRFGVSSSPGSGFGVSSSPGSGFGVSSSPGSGSGVSSSPGSGFGVSSSPGSGSG